MRRPKAVIADAIVAASQHLNRSGLSPGRSGNISERWRDGMLITASGIPPMALNPNTDVVHVKRGGGWTGPKTPSTEWHFHDAIYAARPDATAIVHCHSRYATALACLRKPIPAFHYMVAKAGAAEIPIAPYATFGTPELGEIAAHALTACNACLLANHGQIAIGASLDEAMELAEEVETLAAQYIAALSAGEPVLLEADAMAQVGVKFSTYGKSTASG